MSDPLSISTGDPVIDGIVAVLEGLIVQGIHLADPETRRQLVRDAVAAERAKWPTINPGSESDRVDAIVARHHVERDPMLTVHANVARGVALTLDPTARAAVMALAEHVDP